MGFSTLTTLSYIVYAKTTVNWLGFDLGLPFVHLDVLGLKLTRKPNNPGHIYSISTRLPYVLTNDFPWSYQIAHLLAV